MNKIESWSDFVSTICEFKVGRERRPKYLFRGQSNLEWGLEPAFTRYVNKKEISWGIDCEYKMQELFRLDAHNYITQPILPDHTKKVELWWSTMQHYGVPTRLLDWSYSAYIALYFAVQDLSNKDGALWIVNHAAVNRVAKGKYGFDGSSFLDWFVNEKATNLLWFYEPAVKTDRMLAQQCAFSVAANPLKEHSQLIYSDCNDQALFKIIIPYKLKHDFLKQLNFLNINARTMYPGLDGLGKSIQEFVQIEANET